MAILHVFILALQAAIVKAGLDNALNAVYKRQAPAACSTWEYAIDFCKSASPGFVSLPATEQVPCLCYEGSGTALEWDPSAFDDAVAECAAWAYTADAEDYTIIDSWAGICTEVGNIYPVPTAALSTAVQTPAPSQTASMAQTTAVQPTPAPSSGTILAGCTVFDDIVNSCTSATPDILSLEPGSMAACFCYTRSTSWIPAEYDDAASSCANAVETAHPSDYLAFSSEFVGLCTLVGDVVNSPVVTTTVHKTTSTPKATPVTPIVTPIATPQPTTVTLANVPTSTGSTKSNSAQRILAYEGSMKVLGLSWVLITLIMAML
ncbi:hypothetical protein V8E51_018397 [Hyaloscypha variabilis]